MPVNNNPTGDALIARYGTSDRCCFCAEPKQLQASHIIPAFAFRWLKETGGTGYLRDGRTPNRRAQDGLKSKMLCRDCEQLFSSFETAFANRIFYPFIADNKLRLTYGPWYARFCATVSWRVLAHLIRSGGTAQLTDPQLLAAQRAMQTWEDFIRGDIAHPGAYEQHVLPIPEIDSATGPDLPNNINRFFGRAVEYDFPSGESGGLAMTYAKLGPINIFGYVVPPRNRWGGTRVSVNSGSFGPGQFHLPVELLDYLQDRAHNYRRIEDQISPAQKAKIAATIKANPERFRQSDQMRSMLADARMFGWEAVIDQGE